MKKKVFYSEAAYFVGILILAFGTALTAVADLGVSMIVAPAYLIHLKLSETFMWFTFGLAEYLFQACLPLVLVIVLRRFKLYYIFSAVTVLLYGFLLDMSTSFINFISKLIPESVPIGSISVRIVVFISGFLFSTAGIAFLFNTYISPEVYELFVKEIALVKNKDVHKVKIIYDYTSCFVAIAMSFILFGFGNFEGVKIATILSAFVNGFAIKCFSVLFEKFFEFKERFGLRKYF